MIRGNKGIALILVVSILTVVAITVVSFIFTMRLESRAAANYLWQKKAGYIAEAGIAHARAILREDKAGDFMDTYGDAWRSVFSGSHIDNNDDGKGDSGWIEVVSDGKAPGRYAVLVEDEAAKVNINTAGFHNESPLKVTQGAGPFEVSLEAFLQAKGIVSAEAIAEGIIAYRYGEDNAPGERGIDDNHNSVFLSNDGVDNDADGEIDQPAEGIDEPQEFIPEHPFGEDRPFLATEQIRQVEGVSDALYGKLRQAVTVYSRTASTDSRGNLQRAINCIDARQLLDVLLESGVSDPWQKCVNIVDFADADFAQSTVVRTVKKVYTADLGPRGDWLWQGDHYQSQTSGGAGGNWSWWGIPVGQYYVICYGLQEGQDVGDVTIDGLTHRNLDSGNIFFKSITINEEAHPFFPQGGIGCLRLSIHNNEGLGRTCYFKYIELCSAEGKLLSEVKEIRGVEGIRINEVMVKPTKELVSAAGHAPGGDWSWQGGHYQNAVAAGGVTGEGTWLWEDIPDGEYYLTVFAAEDSQIVGDVRAHGAMQENMRSGERFTERETVRVSAGKFRLDIQNNLSEGTCYFKSALLSQQPDAEYIELVNLTPRVVSLDGWSLEATGTDGWPASIPLGTSIGPGEYLVLAVDKADFCLGIDANAISFEDVWGGLAAAQLDFSRSITSYSDMFEEGGGKLTLRDEKGNIVDIQEYSFSSVKPYISLERGDPTAGGTDQVWFASSDLSGATPGRKNNNAGIIVIEGEETIEHGLDEVLLKNSAFANLGELAQVSCANAWEKLGIEDLMGLADQLTVYSLRLEAEGHKQAGAWAENLRPPPLTAWFLSQNKGEVGTWLWDEQERIPNGVYNLYLYGEKDEAVSLSLHLADDSWTPFTPALTPGANNGVCYGRIEIGQASPISLPAGKIEVQVKNVSANETAHFDYIRLSPLAYVAGKLNINTASVEALQALPLIDEPTARRIINSRPLGNKEAKARGIGDVLSGDILDSEPGAKLTKFGAVSNLITVRSDSFQIISTGQALHNGRVMAEKRIRTVIER